MNYPCGKLGDCIVSAVLVLWYEQTDTQRRGWTLYSPTVVGMSKEAQISWKGMKRLRSVRLRLSQVTTISWYGASLAEFLVARSNHQSSRVPQPRNRTLAEWPYRGALSGRAAVTDRWLSVLMAEAARRRTGRSVRGDGRNYRW